MSQDPGRLQYLFQQFCNDTGTPEEVREFWLLLTELEEDHPVRKDIYQLWDTLDVLQQPEKKDWDTTLQNIHRQAAAWEKKQPAVVRLRPLLRITAAACLILLLGLGSYLLLIQKPKRGSVAATELQRFKNDVPPGSNGATLTLANGKKIVLDSAGNGMLAVQGNTKLMNKNGQIAYTREGNIAGENLYNTITTVRGRQYRLVLADGSKVWLNAASSIRYPANFTGKERKVEITGEVYLEVAKDANKPFFVTVRGMEIQVLGTHFNVNAYEDEADAVTTLIEGSVKVSKKDVSVMLAPGQQAQLRMNGAIGVIKNADVAAAVAWKNGYFSFDNTGIESVMRQLSRWYDIDVSYEGDRVPSESFWGDLQRSATLSSVLNWWY
jgi:transmembrane sensor